MAYEAPDELQRLVYQRLTGFADLVTEVGDRVYDKPRADVVFPYLVIGIVDFQPDDADCITSGEYTVQVDVWSREPGRSETNRIMGIIKRALHDYDGTLSDNALAMMRVSSSRWLDDPDGITTHGVVTVSAMVEEPQ